MAYSPEIKEKARELYIDGSCAHCIAEELKKDVPQIKASIVTNWANKNDWDTGRRQNKLKRDRDKEQETLNVTNQLMNKSSVLIKALYDNIVDQAGKALLQAKTLEGAINSFEKLGSFIDKLDEKGKVNFDSNQVPYKIINSVDRSPKLAKFFMSNPEAWDEFLIALDGEFNSNTRDTVKVIEAK